MLVQLKDRNGNFALLRNRNRASKGEIVFTPIGGGIEATPQGIEELKELLGIEDEAFESKPDLRFMMQGVKANLYLEWFLARRHRETQPFREINEELVDEEKILDWADLKGARGWPTGYSTELAETTKTGQEGKMTLRLLEVYLVQMRTRGLDKLIALASQPSSPIRFASAEEIEKGQMHDGLKIGAVSRALLDRKFGIGPFQ